MTGKRNFGLDIARATAIALVLATHLFGKLITPAIGPFWYLAHLGVDIFFALSGFLIGSILIKMSDTNSGTLSPGNTFIFLCRRWFRTVPLYYLVLLLVFLVERYVYHNVTTFDWRYIFWLQAAGDRPVFFGESWSLCIEEWFYFSFSILFCIFSYATGRLLSLKHKWLLFTLLFIIAVTVYRTHYSAHDYRSFNITFFRLDAIAYGVLMAVVNFYYRDLVTSRSLLIISVNGLGLTATGILLFLSGTYISLYYTLAGAGLAMIVFSLGWLYRKKVPGANAVSFLSRISYSVYLLNLNIILLVVFIAGDSNKALLVAVALTAVIVASMFTYKYVEQVFLGIRDRTMGNDKKALDGSLPSTNVRK
ncbi:MAG: acyltransferase [Chitinophagaceae bacterium]|jgi:peptidoglycan/LPS O-acetylase OafA/YrhL|nr:acyltransferase [Chitinophagaceae bacterium]